MVQRNAGAKIVFWDFLAYVSMFPQLVAGPIVRYSTVASELNSRRVTADDFAYGVKKDFTAGMCKKSNACKQFGCGCVNGT